MKKILKFIAPNGDYVEWGEFDEKKRILTLEVKKFDEDGSLAETEQLDFMLPENFDLNSQISVISTCKVAGFRKTDAPEQGCLLDKVDEDQREVLTD